MKKIILSLLLLLLACSVSESQRRLQRISGTLERDYDDALHNGYIYFSEQGSTTLKQYDGRTFTSFNYPVRDGQALRYFGRPTGMITYRDRLYQILTKESSLTCHLYRFGSSLFRPVAAPRGVSLGISNMVLFSDKIYMIGQRSSGHILYAYDGLSFSEIPGHAFPSSGSCHLRVVGDFLYIQHSSDNLIRYDGSFHTVAGFPRETVKQIFASPGSESAYIQRENGRISFYDGTSTREVTVHADLEFIRTYSLRLSGNVFYFVSATDRPSRISLNECINGDCREIDLPEGEMIAGGEIAVYRDELYVPIHVGTTNYIYRYNGTSFTRFFEYPVVPYCPWLRVRQGNLLIIPRPLNSGNVYEYNGTDFTTILPPTNEWFSEPGKSTSCFHTWGMVFPDSLSAKPADIALLIAAEVPDSTCIPPLPSSEPIAVIPTPLLDYAEFLSGMYAPDRDWCWTNIDIVMPPICIGPGCPRSRTKTTLTDVKGKPVWSKVFDNPFTATLPVDDIEPLALSVSVEKDKTFGQVLLLDNDLVSKGIEAVSFDMSPKDGYFYFAVDTKDENPVPISLTLRNTQGESLWHKKFTAPLDEFIHEYISKPGAYLQVSLGEGISGVSYYPNPFKGSLMIEVQGDNTPIGITLSDLNGKVISQKTLTDPGKHSLDAGNLKSGLYILTIVEGKMTRRELVQVKD